MTEFYLKMKKHENKELRWIRCGLNAMRLDRCISEAQANEKQHLKKIHSILKLYDLLCAIQSEYIELPFLWQDVAHSIVAESKSYLARISFNDEDLRILEICMAAAFLLDNKKFIHKFAIRFIKKYEQCEKQKLFNEFDYDGEDDAFLTATTLYLICRFSLDSSDNSNLNIIPQSYKYRIKNEKLIGTIHKLLFALANNDDTTFIKYLQNYLQSYISREHEGMSYYYRHYSPMASILYLLACKKNKEFLELDKIKMRCKIFDYNETFKLRTYNVYVTDFILSSRQLSPPLYAIPAKNKHSSPNRNHHVIRKNLITVPLEAETIDCALKMVKDGGTVLIQPGQYELSEIINIKKSVIIKGESDNAEDVVLLNQKSSVIIISAPHVTLNNLTLTTSNIYADALIINRGNIIISNCRVTSKEKTGVLLNGKYSQLQIENSIIECCREYGLIVQNKAKATIRNCAILKCICSVELSAYSECLFYDTQLSGTFYLHDNSKTKMTGCRMNSSIIAVKKSTASLIACKIVLPQMGSVGAADQSEILCSECDIKSVSKTLSAVYATTYSLITLQKCSISTPLKKFFREEKEGIVNVFNG